MKKTFTLYFCNYDDSVQIWRPKYILPWCWLINAIAILAYNRFGSEVAISFR